ncbi:MAG TPA: hypothetical protein VMX97_00430, partial [Hyphomicrobiaceae bacterium]|nr:hypothetical protein [Hyphomicrobiaceae bacterium]
PVTISISSGFVAKPAFKVLPEPEPRAMPVQPTIVPAAKVPETPIAAKLEPAAAAKGNLCKTDWGANYRLFAFNACN